MIAAGAEQWIPERLAEMREVEWRIQVESAAMAEENSQDPDAAEIFLSASRLAGEHIQRLHDRMATLGLDPPAETGPACGDAAARPASAALRRLFALLGEAAIGYGALAPIANRFRDSAVTAPDGMTGHLARDHSQHYLRLMGQIAGTVQAVVLRELSSAGFDCQCICPACGLGLCVCGVGARAGFNEAWLAARPVMDACDITIPAPRAASTAAAAGFREGDRLVSGDGAAFVSYPQLQTTINGHAMGETVRFVVTRAGRQHSLVAQRAADLADTTLPLDCEAPAGPLFYLDRARDLQQRLRRRSQAGQASRGMAALSVREAQVLRLIADGATNPMIAAKLRISRPTVARHVANILAKLDVTNRSEAAAMAALHGLSSD